MLTDDRIEELETKHKPQNGPGSFMSFARAVANESARAMQSKCAAIVEAPHFKIVVRNELRRRAEEIRAVTLPRYPHDD